MAGFYEGAYGSIPGPPGADGADGADGRSLLSGIGAPGAGLGVNGDWYIDTGALAIYGPKTGGAWGSGTSLQGPGLSNVDTGNTAPDPLIVGDNFIRLNLAPAPGENLAWVTISGAVYAAGPISLVEV